MATPTDHASPTGEPQWLTPGVRGIGTASLLADLGHEVPTALLPALLTSTLGAPASALGLIESVADGLRAQRASPAGRWPTIRSAAGRSRSAATRRRPCSPG